eukprot:m.1072269 g.1072269  ORF g.1072269 m.1072269 type:complete len:179 (+) comp24231_c0_seq108:2635-3171(+)
MHCNVFDASLSLHNTVGVWGWGRGPDVATQVTYTMVLSNPTFDESPFRVTSSVGEIVSITESALDQSEKSVFPGYLPGVVENATLGKSTNTTIAGADVRVFDIVVQENASVVDPIPPVAPPRGGTVACLHSFGTVKALRCAVRGCRPGAAHGSRCGFVAAGVDSSSTNIFHAFRCSRR